MISAKNILILFLLGLVSFSCSSRKNTVKKDCEEMCYPYAVSWEDATKRCVCRPEVK